MNAPAISASVRFEAAHQRLEQLVQEAAEAERAAFVAWQEAYGAYEVARDEASAVWTTGTEAVAS